jgi:hypothetical protein
MSRRPILLGPAPRPAVPRRARRRRNVRLVADVGLSLVPVFVVEILTGLVLFAFGHGLAPKNAPWAAHVFDFLASTNLLVIQDISFQTDVHVWAGYLTCWTIALKAWGSWPTLIGWWPRRLSPPRLVAEKAAAWSLLALAPASYVTGLALTLRPMHLANPLLRDLHLWVSALLLLPLTWHAIRFLPTGLKVFWVQLKRLGAAPAHPSL